MRTYIITYITRGNISQIYHSDDLDLAKSWAEEFLSNYKQVPDNVDPYTDIASMFFLEIWSYTKSWDDPELIYSSPYYYENNI